MSLKYWVLIGVLVLGMQAIPPLPGQAAGTAGPSSRNVEQDGKGKKATAAPALPLAESAKPIGTDKDSGNVTPNNPEYNVKLSSIPVVTVADKDKTFLDHLFDWGPWIFSLLLVGIGALALKVADRQADLMGKQAELMERQAALMEAPFAQWIDLTNWRVEKQRATKIWIMVDIINPTDFPITLSDSYLNFARYGHPEQHSRYLLAEKTFLSPKTPKTIELWIGLTEAEQTAGSVSFPVTGELSHFHRISGKIITQKVDGRLDCGPMMANDPWVAMFNLEAQMNPEEKQPEQSNNKPAN